MLPPVRGGICELRWLCCLLLLALLSSSTVHFDAITITSAAHTSDVTKRHSVTGPVSASSEGIIASRASRGTSTSVLPHLSAAAKFARLSVPLPATNDATSVTAIQFQSNARSSLPLAVFTPIVDAASSSTLLVVSYSVIAGALMASRHLQLLASNTSVEAWATAESWLPSPEISKEIAQTVNLTLTLIDSGVDPAAIMTRALVSDSTLMGGIGNVFSRFCVPNSLACAAIGMPLISPSCTAASLSDKGLHSTFLRVVPSDEAQSRIIAGIVQLFGWSQVAIIWTVEAYGSPIAASVQAQLNSASPRVQIKPGIGIVPGATTNATIAALTAALEAVVASGSRIVVLALADWIPEFFEICTSPRFNLLTDDFVFIGSDTVLSGVNGVALDRQRIKQLRGLIAVTQSAAFRSPEYMRFQREWARQNVSDYQSYMPHLPNNFFEQAHDEIYPATAYDSVLVYGTAAVRLRQRGEVVSRSSILAEMLSSNFQVNGTVTSSSIQFDSTGNVSPSYAVYNLQSLESGDSVGMQLVATVSSSSSDSADATLRLLQKSGLQASVRFHDGTSTPPIDQTPDNFINMNVLISPAEARQVLPITRASRSALPLGSLTVSCDQLFNITQPIGPQPVISSAAQFNCTGGISRRLAYIEQQRLIAKEDVLLISTGGAWNPTAMYRADEGDFLAQVMVRAKFDVMAINTADFAFAPTGFAKFLTKMANYAANNADSSNHTCSSFEPSAPGQLASSNVCFLATTLEILVPSTPLASFISSVIVKRLQSGSLVGFINVQRGDFNQVTNLNAELQQSEVQATLASRLQQTIDELRFNRSVTVIILLAFINSVGTSPVAGQSELSTLMLQLTNVSLVLIPFETPASSSSSNPQVEYLVDSMHTEVPLYRIVAGLGDLTQIRSVFDRTTGRFIPQRSTAEYVNLADGSPELPDVQQAMAQQLLLANLQLNQVITTAANTSSYASGSCSPAYATLLPRVNVITPGCRVAPCPIGLLLADILLSVHASCQISHINSGTIRSSLNSGPVTLDMLQKMLPFTLKQVVYSMTGANLLDVIRYSISQAGYGGYQQWAGVRFSYTLNNLPSSSSVNFWQRVTVSQVSVRNRKLEKWEPLVPTQTYAIASVEFVTSGGDGFGPFMSKSTSKTLLQTEFIDTLVQWLGVGLLQRSLVARTTGVNFLPACWNSTYTLAYDPKFEGSNAYSWPVAPQIQDCLWISASEPPGTSLCPTYEEYKPVDNSTSLITMPSSNQTSVNRTSSTVDDSIYRCRCIQTHTRDADTQSCIPCRPFEIKRFKGDQPCVCSENSYLPPLYLQGSLFRCVDPSGYLRYATPDPLNLTLARTCQLGPQQCMRFLIWNELQPEFNTSSLETFDEWNAPWYVMRGWWWNTSTAVVYRCDTARNRRTTCNGTYDSIQKCVAGFDGPLCTLCAPNHGGFSPDVCLPCDAYAYSVLFLILSILAAGIGLLFIVYSSFMPLSRASSLSKILIRHAQSAAVVGQLRIYSSEVMQTLTATFSLIHNSGSHSLAYRCVMALDSIQHLQVSTAAVGGIFLLWMIALISREIRKRWWPTVDDGKLLKMVDSRTFLCGCCCNASLDDQDENHLQISMPDLSAPTRVRTSSAAKGRAIAKMSRLAGESDTLTMINPNAAMNTSVDLSMFKSWSWEQVCIPILAVIVLFLYPSLVQESVYFMMPCWDINGERLLQTDLSINCADDRYKSWWWVAAARLGIIGLGVPLVVLFRIATHLRAFRNPEDTRRAEMRSFFLRYRFLVEAYTNDAWYWEVVGMARQNALAICVVLLRQDDVTQAGAVLCVLTIALVLQVWFKPYSPMTLSSVRPSVRSLHSFGRRVSDPNNFELISLSLLIGSVGAAALVQSDLISGGYSPDDLSLTTYNYSVVNYNTQDAFLQRPPSVINEYSDVTPFALSVQWLVVLLHSAFTLYVLYAAFPQWHSLRWWKKQRDRMIQILQVKVDEKENPQSDDHDDTVVNQKQEQEAKVSVHSHDANNRDFRSDSDERSTHATTAITDSSTSGAVQLKEVKFQMPNEIDDAASGENVTSATSPSSSSSPGATFALPLPRVTSPVHIHDPPRSPRCVNLHMLLGTSDILSSSSDSPAMVEHTAAASPTLLLSPKSPSRTFRIVTKLSSKSPSTSRT